MSAAKVAVFVLKLISFFAVLCSLALGIGSLFIPVSPVEDPTFGTVEISPGCFMVILLVIFIPLSLIPAFAAWMVQQRVVLPREAAEQRWRGAMAEREERLWVWAGYVTNLLLHHGGAAGSVPLLRADMPRAFGELDLGRRKRLLLFLREVGLGGAVPGDPASTVARVAEGELAQALPSRSLVRAVAVLLSMASAFLVLWLGLSVISILTTDAAYQVLEGGLGIKVDKAQLLVPIPGCLIAAVFPGLAGVGLLRMHRQAVRSLRQQESSGAAVQDRALRGAVESFGAAPQIARAAALTALPELDGSRRGKLIQALFASGRLTGESRISLEGADLRGAELAGASLPGASLAGADLSGNDLSGADLCGAELSRAALRGSDLRSCKLAGADFRGADLSGARLQKAELEGADLREVLLDGANFWGAGLSGANLAGARGTAEFLNLGTVAV